MHDLSIFKLAPAGYSVHDLARIGASKKKLLWLVENKIFDLRDVPVDEIDLSDIQLNQVPVRKRGKPIVDHDGIQGELEGLQDPKLMARKAEQERENAYYSRQRMLSEISKRLNCLKHTPIQ